MAAQNLFEKYGIKEVADVTFYRIDRVDETYESQRKILVSSILKSSVELKTVYPLTEVNGEYVGAEDGFEAYVFPEAEILTGTNYTCDDEGVTGTLDENRSFTLLAAGDGNMLVEKGLAELEDGVVVITALSTSDQETANQETSKEDENKQADSEPTAVDEEDDNSVTTDPTTSSTTDSTTSSIADPYKVGDVIYFDLEYVIKKTAPSILRRNTLVNPFLQIGMRIENVTSTAIKFKIVEESSYQFRRNINNYVEISVPVQEVKFKVTEKDAKDADIYQDGILEKSETVLVPLKDSIKPFTFDGTFIEMTVQEAITAGIIKQTDVVKALASALDLNEDEIEEQFDENEQNYGTQERLQIRLTTTLGGDAVETASDVTVPTRDGNTFSLINTSIGLKFILNKMAGPDGTHEYTYAQQLLMLFAQDQNLITRKGTRYTFEDYETIFGNFSFNDNYAVSPNSSERQVVLVYANHTSEALYKLDEIQEEMNKLNQSISAKAYDVEYDLYAELFVEDEMGYYDQTKLGSGYARENDVNTPYTMTITGSYTDVDSHYKELDPVLAGAVTWDNSVHDSINDAIDALRAKKKILDASEDDGLSGFSKISGGYKVSNDLKPNAADGIGDYLGRYEYTFEDDASYPLSDGVALDNKNLKYSKYSLSSVLDYLEQAANLDNSAGDEITVGVSDQLHGSGLASNRAIYVRVDGAVDMSARAYIYILRNRNYKILSSDVDGIFSFYDRKGNLLYYQDPVFAGTEYLALIVIGNKGIIFTLGRHGNKKIEKVAWMVNEKGYINDKLCQRIVDHGVIHTTTVTVDDESFDATCQLSGFKVKKIKKKVMKYTPVLFLDTLKVSTIEQTAEQTSATGGRGNAELIIWDYGKEITLSLEDALYTPASMSAMFGSSKDKDFTKGVKDTKRIDRTEKCTAARSFIIPAGNSKGVPSEGDLTAQAVYIDLNTMQPYEDGTPIAEGEVYLKWTRSVAYGENSLGNTIEISAERFPGTYRIVGDTFARNKTTGEDQRFQFIIPQAKMSSEQTITLEAEGDPTVFSMEMKVLRPDDGVMVKLVQYDVVENTEENDGSTMVKDTENLNLLDDAEMYRVSSEADDDDTAIGATEY